MNYQERLDVKSNGLHEFDSIARSNDPFSEPVVKTKLAGFQFFLKVDVAHTPRKKVRKRSEREIVRCHQANPSLNDQGTENAFCADTAILGIRSLQHLVKEEQSIRSG